MIRALTRFLCVAVAFTGAACTDSESATDLNSEGPPMVRQVRLTERYTPVGSTTTATQRVFAFGSHPLAAETEVHAVTNAAARNNQIRVIMDELLVGNHLEEIQCRGLVDDDAFGRVPLVATPDDVANCSVGDDVLNQTCTGPGAVCICQNAAGCTRGAATVPMGQPVGVQDINQDGATDDTHFILGSAGIRCGTVDVRIDLERSYWNPSGDQNKPAQGGFDALGPAIVLTPDGALPTNIECGLSFSPDVVDKSGNGVCTPPDGDVTKDCSPGDLAAFKFKVEPLVITPASPEDMAVGVDRNGPLLFEINAAVDLATAMNITGTPALPAFTATSPMPNLLQLDLMAPLAANTMYTVTIPVTVTDSYGQPLPQAIVFTFTTGA